MFVDSHYTLMFMLIFGHAVADYPLQGDFLSKAKNHKQPIPGIDWYVALSMHCIIHAGVVFLITQSLLLALLEYIAHMTIDYLKSDNIISFKTDQSLHVWCKIAWFGLYVSGIK